MKDPPRLRGGQAPRRSAIGEGWPGGWRRGLAPCRAGRGHSSPARSGLVARSQCRRFSIITYIDIQSLLIYVHYIREFSLMRKTAHSVHCHCVRHEMTTLLGLSWYCYALM